MKKNEFHIKKNSMSIINLCVLVVMLLFSSYPDVGDFTGVLLASGDHQKNKNIERKHEDATKSSLEGFSTDDAIGSVTDDGINTIDDDLKDEVNTTTDDSMDDEKEDHDNESTTPQSITNEEETTTGAAVSKSAVGIITQTALVPGGTARVKTYDELRRALANNNGVTNVFLEANITAATGTIDIYSSKKLVMISGINSVGANYTYTEASDNRYNNYIRIPVNGSLIVEDLNINGSSQGGAFFPVDYEGRGTTLTFSRVNYNGPRLASSLGGKIEINDCSIQLNGVGYATTADAAQGSEISVGGDTTITQSGGTFPVFGIYNLTGTPKLSILSDANVVITASRFLIRGNVNTTYADLNIEENATLQVTAPGGVTEDNHSLGDLTVGDNGVFQYKHTGTNGSKATISFVGNIDVGTDAIFDVRRSPSSGSAGSGLNVLLNMKSNERQINFANSERVILINGVSSSDGLIKFDTRGYLNINTHAVNQWTTLPTFMADVNASDPLVWDFLNLPSQRWNYKDVQPFSFYSICAGTSVEGDMMAVYPAYIPASDENTQSLNGTNFLGGSAKALTLGKHQLNTDIPTDESTTMGGQTLPGAQLAYSYETVNNIPIQEFAQADSSGKFIATFTDFPKFNSHVITESQKDFLRAYSDEAVIRNQEILAFVDVPSSLDFGKHVPTQWMIIPRHDENWEIKVMDTRLNANSWEIYVSADDPLSTYQNEIYRTLPGDLVFATQDALIPINDTALLAYEGTTDPSSQDGISTVKWDDYEGPLVALYNITEILMNAEYSTNVKWTLVSGP